RSKSAATKSKSMLFEIAAYTTLIAGSMQRDYHDCLDADCTVFARPFWRLAYDLDLQVVIGCYALHHISGAGRRAGRRPQEGRSSGRHQQIPEKELRRLELRRTRCRGPRARAGEARLSHGCVD